MKALVCKKYGSPNVLRFEEVEKPVPGEAEVLIKVQAVSLNAYDLHFLKADPFFIRFMGGAFLRPMYPILGADVAGRVEAVGAAVKRLKPGDEVFGDIGHGGLAEYACAREDLLALKPANLTSAEAAAVTMAGLTALQGLRDHGQIQAGKKVLINGASGGVGTFAVQLAKYFGAEVTAVCSTRNVEQARSLGADTVIDYTREDFTKADRKYDLILAANGYHSIYAYRRALNPTGIYVMAGGSMSQMFQALALGPRLTRSGGQKLGSMLAQLNQKDMDVLTGLLASGRIKPVVDQQYPFSQAVEAFRYLDAGHARGKVVITLE